MLVSLFQRRVDGMIVSQPHHLEGIGSKAAKMISGA